MNTIAVIQSRTGSTRLPGKVMYPLNGKPALKHVIARTAQSERVTDVVVATSTKTTDDVIEQFGEDHEISIYRGSEENVQERMFQAATAHNAETVVRITGDCPLIDPETIDTVVSRIRDRDAEYASNILQRTFPRGLDVEAFSYESFEKVKTAESSQTEREHVTPYYRENPDEFDIATVTSEEVFDDERYINRTDLRLTLDEANDYCLLKKIYDGIEYTDLIPIRDAIDYIDAEGLTEINEAVRQKKL